MTEVTELLKAIEIAKTEQQLAETRQRQAQQLKAKDDAVRRIEAQLRQARYEADWERKAHEEAQHAFDTQLCQAVRTGEGVTFLDLPQIRNGGHAAVLFAEMVRAIGLETEIVPYEFYNGSLLTGEGSTVLIRPCSGTNQQVPAKPLTSDGPTGPVLNGC